jgi:aspartate kinase
LGICSIRGGIIEKVIERIDCSTKLSKFTLHRVPDRTGLAADIFMALGQHGINVELISTSSAGHKHNNISFAILESNVDEVLKLLETIKDKFGGEKVGVDRNCALITIYGAQLSTTPGIAGKIFAKLAEQGINIEMISASLSVLSIVVNIERMEEAVTIIRTHFAQ